ALPAWYPLPMAYETTAALKRPRGFEELAGQEFVSATLKASLDTGRIAHAYLFSGPRGCGKTSTARILAKSLNCERGPSSSPCGECSSCRSIQRGAAFDVIEIDGASNTSVDNVRQIKDEVLFPPASGRYKVYIIDEVHMLSNSAFNALLKTIEEPPPYIVFIFATTELHKVPATIKSRCQQFKFRLIPLDVIHRLLAEAAAERGIEADAEALLWIAREAAGSLRDAYTLLDQAASFSDGGITYEKVRDKLGLVGVDRMNILFEHCVRAERAGALEWVDETLGRGVSPEQCVADAAEYIRTLLLIKAGITRESILGDAPSRYSAEVLEALSPERIERALAEILDLYRDLRYSADPRTELEVAVVRFCSIRDWIPVSEALRAVEDLRAWTLSAAASAAPGLQGVGPETGSAAAAEVRGQKKNHDRKPAVHLGAASADPSSLRKAVLSLLSGNHVVLASALDNSLDWILEDGRLEIRFRSDYEEAMARRDLEALVQAAREAAGRALRVELRAAGPQPNPPVPAHQDSGTAQETVDEVGDPVGIVERVFRGKRVEIEAPRPRMGGTDGNH
ncbi:MAG TPA: DNA polymerase III subunit gamma/tau, partial [Magnetospirillaceae bacterium]|nr:DNA polymerase III subunit gamma/tau [Magnetospirillaceae bacterium]